MRFISLVALLVSVAMASATDPKETRHYDLENARDLFAQFIKDFNREYKDDADREVHYTAFLKSLAEINRLNEKNPAATFGINKFADYTDEERKNMFGVRKAPK